MMTPRKPLSTVFPPCIIFINGFPGVGKYTIARKLAALLPNARLLDNHTLIDPVEAIEPGRTPEHYAFRKAIRTAAFNGIKHNSCKELTMIMTSCTSSSLADTAVFLEHLQIAKHRKAPFVSVNVTCSDEANAQRLVTSKRTEGAKTKLTNVEVLVGLKQNAVLLDPRIHLAEARRDFNGVEMHHLELDSTDLSPDEAAAVIAEFLKK